MAAWLDAGRELSQENAVLPETSWMFSVPQRQVPMVVGIDTVIEKMNDASVVLLDVRDSPEYDGIRQMEANPRLGRIPGGRSFEWTRFLERRYDYPALAGTSRNEGYIFDRLRPADDIRDDLLMVGVTNLDAEIVLYCQKSHRASLAYVALEECGYTNVQVFIGSFREWSKRLDLPIEK
jgi:thiosulfate/3-mercaptopyruvate sulfurtransferase